MAKRFFETFPALILEDELKDLFEFAEVTANSNRSFSSSSRISAGNVSKKRFAMKVPF